VVRVAAQLEKECAAIKPDIAVIVTPGEVAQTMTDRVVKCGVTAILNFAPVQLQSPPQVSVKNVNLVLELEALSFALANR
jgi:redox-sensing transcriptional repressor